MSKYIPTGFQPTLEHAFRLKITLEPAIEYGQVDGRKVRFIAITGGTISGPLLEGTVLAGGGDWQSIDLEGRAEVDARYSLKSSDGTIIGITNPGIRVASPEITARLANGEEVDPSLYYFCTNPRFIVEKGRYDWLRRSIFVGRGIRRPDHVLLDVYVVK